MGFWEIIDAWLNQADDRKVVIHRHGGKTTVDLFWRGHCTRKYTKEETSEVRKPPETKTKPKRKKRK